MSNLAYLGFACLLSLVGLVALWLVRRRPNSIQAGLDAFSRELDALAPPDARATRSEAHIDGLQPTPIRRPRRQGSNDRQRSPSSRHRAQAPGHDASAAGAPGPSSDADVE